MNRKWFLVLCAVIMLALALVVARVFREPLPPLAGDMEAPVGDSVSGPLQTAPTAALPSPLPSPEAMIMRSGDSAPLPVTTVEPQAAAPTGVAPVVRDGTSGAGTITEPPAPPSTPEPTTSAPAREASAADTPPVAPLSSSPEQAVPAPSAPDAQTSAPSGQERTPSVQTAPAPSAPSQAAPDSAPQSVATPSPSPSAAPDTKSDQPLKPGTLVTKSSLPAKAGSRVVSAATLTMDGDVVTLNLRGGTAMRGKTFILTGPDRVVLDIEGDWKVEAPRVPSNRMVRSLRVGAQNTSTRLVFDMRVKPVKVQVTNPAPDCLELTIR